MDQMDIFTHCSKCDNTSAERCPCPCSMCVCFEMLRDSTDRHGSHKYTSNAGCLERVCLSGLSDARAECHMRLLTVGCVCGVVCCVQPRMSHVQMRACVRRACVCSPEKPVIRAQNMLFTRRHAATASVLVSALSSDQHINTTREQHNHHHHQHRHTTLAAITFTCTTLCRSVLYTFS